MYILYIHNMHTIRTYEYTFIILCLRVFFTDTINQVYIYTLYMYTFIYIHSMYRYICVCMCICKYT